MDLLDRKIYRENAQVMLIVEQQFDKSRSLIIEETSSECFVAVKYCTIQILQQYLKNENKFIRKEVQVNLKKELEITVEKIKSRCTKYQDLNYFHFVMYIHNLSTRLGKAKSYVEKRSCF